MAPLFAGVVFFVHDSVPLDARTALAKTLADGGGARSRAPQKKETALHMNPATLTHCVTRTLDFPECQGLLDSGVAIVLPSWVTRSVEMERLQLPRHYSPDTALFLAGLVVCTSGMPSYDAACIECGVESLGGQYRRELTREVTHLIVLAPHGDKYDDAIKYGPELGMVIVLPHWFEDCVKYRTLVDTREYEFPDPPLYRIPPALPDAHKSTQQDSVEAPRSPSKASLPPARFGTAEARAQSEVYQRTAVVNCLAPETSLVAALSGSAFLGESLAATASSISLNSSNPNKDPTIFPPYVAIPPLAKDKIFAERRVYFAADLGIRFGMESALKQRIIDGGGTCWSWSLDGADAVASTKADSGRKVDQWARRRAAERELKRANTVVMRFREGWEFWVAFEADKTIGNLAWLYNVLSSSKIASPLDRILHYPLPRTPIPGGSELEVTVSNYTTFSRDYARTMIELLGGKYTGTMARTSTHVCSANLEGKKVEFAKSWGVAIVSHLWLEACLAEWELLDIDSSPTYRPLATLDAGTAVLGTTPLLRASIDRWAGRPAVQEARRLTLAAIPGSFDTALRDSPSKNVQIDMVAVDKAQAEQQARNLLVERPVHSFKQAAQELAAGKSVTSQGVSGDEGEEQAVTGDEDIVMVDARVAQAEGESDGTTLQPEEDELEEDELEEDELEEPSVPSPSPPPVVKAPKKPVKPLLKTVAARDPAKSVIKVALPSIPSDESVVILKVPRAPKASTSALPLRAKINGTPKRGNSSLEKLPTSAQRNGLDTSAILEKGRKRAAAGAASSALTTAMEKETKHQDQLKEQAKRKGKKRIPDEFDQLEESAGKGKGRRMDSSDDEDGEAVVRLRVQVGKRSKRNEVVVINENLAPAGPSGEGTVSSFDASLHAKPPPNRKDKSIGAVRYFQSGIGLDDKLRVKLAKLGAQEVDKPSQVTHLIVIAIARTVKFMQALANAPIVVSDRWMTDSVAAGRLLDESKYLLVDPVGEKKHKMNLVESLRRAREGKLFKGLTFYITAKPKTDRDIVKQIIECHGGLAVYISKMPPRETLAEGKQAYVISSAMDQHLWESYASISFKGPPVPIFSSEAILEGCMRQELPFGADDGFRLGPQVYR